MKTALLALCLFLAGCGGRPGVREIRIAHLGPGFQSIHVPIVLTDSLGYFKDEGLSVTLENFNSNAKTVQALVGGSVDVAGIGYMQTIQMAAEGQRLRSFFVVAKNSGVVLAVTPSGANRIRRIEDLKGGVIGVPGPGSPTHMIVSVFLQSHGISAADVSIASIGTSASAMAAVESGRMDAVALSSGNHVSLLRRHPGTLILADTSTAEGTREAYGIPEAPAGAVAARQEWLDANPDAARRLARALVRGQSWLRTHSPQEIRDRLPDAMRSTSVEEDIEIIRWSQPTFTDAGRMPVGGPEAMKKLLDATSEKVRGAKIDLAATWTNEYLPEGK